MNNCNLCFEYGDNAIHRDSSVKVTIFDNPAIEDIVSVLEGDIDPSLPVDEMNKLLKARLDMLEKYAGKYVALSKDGYVLGSDESYTKLFTSGKIHADEVRLYHVPPRNRWGYPVIPN